MWLFESEARMRWAKLVPEAWPWLFRMGRSGRAKKPGRLAIEIDHDGGVVLLLWRRTDD